MDIFDYLNTTAIEDPKQSNLQKEMDPAELKLGDIVEFISYGGQSLRSFQSR